MSETKHSDPAESVRRFNEEIAGEVELDEEDVDGDSDIAAGTLHLGRELSGARLDDANLAGKDLSGANLSRASLEGTDLSGADLRNANIRDASLVGATLRSARLEGAVLTGAELYLAVLKDASYDRATRWPDGFEPQKRGATLASS